MTDAEPVSTSGGSGSGESGGADGSAGGEEDFSFCGNGIVEGDEQCDEGPANDNNDQCTKGCTLARCDDGFVQSGEICDDGEATLKEGDEANIPYGKCLNCTAMGHYCGDGTIEVEHEQCEPQMAQPTTRCEISCRFVSRWIFLTSTQHLGDLSDIRGGAGIGAIDAHCNMLAGEAGLSGSFRAWLAVSGGSAASRFSSFEEGDKTNFVRPDGDVVAEGFAELLDGPDPAIDLDETGESVGPVNVWTNIMNNGAASKYDCSQWEKVNDDNNALLYGLVGRNEAGETWTQKNTEVMKSIRPCNLYARLYCVQYAD